MPFKDFLAAIKTQADTAPEDLPMEDAKNEVANEDKPGLELELTYKMRVPKYCTSIKKFADDQVYVSCK